MTASPTDSRVPALGHFRSHWLDDPYPLVVEAPGAQAEAVCAAPSLWMGGRRLAGQLQALGVGPGVKVRAPERGGAVWLWGMLATLRRGAVYVAAGVDPCPVHIGSSGRLVLRGGPRPTGPEGPGLILEQEGRATYVSAHALPLGANPPQRNPDGWPVEVTVDAAWGRHGVFMENVWPALLAGAEIRVPG